MDILKKSVNVVLGFRLTVGYLALYDLFLLLFYESLIGLWAGDNNSFNYAVSLLPLEIYGAVATPSFVVTGLFLSQYKKFSFGTSKVLWYVLVCFSVIACCVTGIGSLFVVPHILSDGNEAWAIVFGSFVYSPFVVFSTVSFLLLEKRKIELFKKTYYYDDEGRRVDPQYD